MQTSDIAHALSRLALGPEVTIDNLLMLPLIGLHAHFFAAGGII